MKVVSRNIETQYRKSWNRRLLFRQQ